MSTIRRDQPPNLGPRAAVRPRSPAEALEPGRGPARPRSAKNRPASKQVSGFVRFMSGLFTLALGLAIVTGAGVLVLYHIYEKPGPLETNLVLVIPKGEGRTEIADRLEKEGYISNRWAFMAVYLSQRYFGPRAGLELKAGEYDVKAGASMRDVLETLASGSSVGHKVGMPEGLTSQQVVERLKYDPNLVGEVMAIPSEGSLAPDTYTFSKGSDRNEIVKSMQAAQTKRLEEAWQKRQQGLPFETKEQALVLASIVEKETGRSDERKKVAAVFINRLRKGMALQSDPTILYGLYGGAVQWGKPILQSEKDAKNAHNTYQIKGLPPTPICNPGLAAIEAVLNPAATKDLYFVADGDGGHIFSETLKDHNAAVANWRKAEKEMRAKEEAEAKAAAAVAAQPAAAAKGEPGGARSVITTLEQGGAGSGGAIPNPPAEDAKEAAKGKEAAGGKQAADAKEAAQKGSPVVTIETKEAAAPALIAPAGGPASNVPLPVRKPKP
jgi:UPF0755 protein